MAQYDIPLAQVPNQFFTTSLNGVTWAITLETRLNNLYISLSNNNDGDVLLNRICLNRTYLGHGFVFVDIDGNSDPEYTGLGTRYLLIWTDEV
ncbi:hypothetical protein [Acinetobacter phage vB_AbaM_BP10]|nr:hypothetical protein [Acinetobacter phage vB_AbaM_BP10]